MSNETCREAVARAIFVSEGWNEADWPRFSAGTRRQWHRQADAALAALGIPGDMLVGTHVVVPREPTPEMLAAWSRHQTERCMATPPLLGNPGVGYWRAMLAARPGAEGGERE